MGKYMLAKPYSVTRRSTSPWLGLRKHTRPGLEVPEIKHAVRSASAAEPRGRLATSVVRQWRKIMTPGPGYNKGGEYPYPYFYRLYLNFSLFLYTLPTL